MEVKEYIYNVKTKTGTIIKRKITEEELLQIKKNQLLLENSNKRNKLISWFKDEYTKYEQMLTRRNHLGKKDIIIDKFRNKTYHNLTELYEEAEIVAEEINELKENKED